ncbi:MAG TPA: DNA damage-inducible protein D [Ktedonobacteraceae bacterium]|nr:DNA damage-inducible protein D [Ktedonobacteraceae bacterium]
MIQTPDFDSIKQVNPYGQEYWSARDLAPLLGYIQWRNFELAIKKAMIACASTDNPVDQHFADASKSSTMPHGGVREIKNYNLSRFACYLVAQNGDSRKPEIAAAQVYFAVSTRAHEIHQLLKEQEKRLETRFKVSESFKLLAASAQGPGVLSENFGIFVDAGYLGLHHHTVEELKAMKSIPPKEDYLDNIGREELSAIDFKNIQTDAKLRRDQITDEDVAIDTHHFVGGQVRKAIEAIHAPMPETLPSAPSIRKLVEERRKAAKKRRLKADKQSNQHSLLAEQDEANTGQ